MKVGNILTLCILPFFMLGQETDFSIFNPLMGKTWKAEGNWGDGSKFVQEVTMEYALDSTIINVKSIGFIDEEQTKLGVRNQGIRRLDKKSGNIRFWEFDVFGGLTEGVVIADGKNIIYQYEYGGYSITDMWEYVNESTYNFKVGNYDMENRIWNRVYLNTEFKASKPKNNE